MNMLAVALLGLAATGAEEGPWRLSPKFLPGQEIVYRGTATEIRVGPSGARFEQSQDLETSMLVLEMSVQRVGEVGCYTVVRMPDQADDRGKDGLEEVTTVHFDLVKVTPEGRATWANSNAQIAMPTDGSVPWELGYLYEGPENEVEPGGAWVVRKPGLPPIRCRANGIEKVDGISCVKVVSVQQSQNWEAKHVHFTAWRNLTALWIDPNDGLVRKVLRESKMRHSGDEASTHAVRVEYQRVSNVRYHGDRFQQRVSDFRIASRAQSELETALAAIDRTGPLPFRRIKERLRSAVADKLYTTPYRPAIQRMMDSAERMFRADAASAKPVRQSVSVAELGKRTKNFVVRNVDTGESVTPKKLVGTPAVLVLVDPVSALSQKALRSAVSAAGRRPKGAVVFAVCSTVEEEAIEQLKLLVPGEYILCSGPGLDRSFGANGYPHTIFIDAEGILRGNHPGLGPEVYPALAREVARYGAEFDNIGNRDDKKRSFLR